MLESTELPAEFLERLRAIVGEEHYPKCLASFRDEKNTSFRVNVARVSVENVCAELKCRGVAFSPLTWCDHAFLVPHESRPALLDSPAFNEGHIYVQNASSLLPVAILDPRPDETVLDLAAAPGGKTLHIASRMKHAGVLSAVEPIKSRFYRLKRNLQLHGADFVKTYFIDGRTVGQKTGERFDRVLLDAPCSSESRFRANDPETWAYWNSRKIREQARKQKGLLKSAIRATRPGGIIVYCTCSFAPEENEMVVSEQLKRFGDAIRLESCVAPIDNQIEGLIEWQGKALHQSLRNACRVLPTSDFDGFFICKLKKLKSA